MGLKKVITEKDVSLASFNLSTNIILTPECRNCQTWSGVTYVTNIYLQKPLEWLGVKCQQLNAWSSIQHRPVEL